MSKNQCPESCRGCLALPEFHPPTDIPPNNCYAGHCSLGYYIEHYQIILKGNLQPWIGRPMDDCPGKITSHAKFTEQLISRLHHFQEIARYWQQNVNIQKCGYHRDKKECNKSCDREPLNTGGGTLYYCPKCYSVKPYSTEQGDKKIILKDKQCLQR